MATIGKYQTEARAVIKMRLIFVVIKLNRFFFSWLSLQRDVLNRSCLAEEEDNTNTKSLCSKTFLG